MFRYRYSISAVSYITKRKYAIGVHTDLWRFQQVALMYIDTLWLETVKPLKCINTLLWLGVYVTSWDMTICPQRNPLKFGFSGILSSWGLFKVLEFCEWPIFSFSWYDFSQMALPKVHMSRILKSKVCNLITGNITGNIHCRHFMINVYLYLPDYGSCDFHIRL